MPNAPDSTILVVDDDESVLNLVFHQLAPLECTVIPTTSPAEAIHLLRSREIALLFCDLGMPTLDGNVVLAAAREANPDIVSVLMSGRADKDAIVKALNEGGIWRYIEKPWRQSDLLTCARKGLERYQRLHHTHADLGEMAKTVARGRTAPRLAASPKKGPVVLVRHNPAKPHAERGDRVRRPAAPLSLGGAEGSRYRLLERLGEGRTGEVFRARDSLLDMTVAVKLLAPDCLDSEPLVQTFKEEARIAMHLSHRHIVRLHNLSRWNGRYYMVMEYVNGCTLREVLASYGRLSVESALQVLTVAAGALAYAHRHHVLHKDLKPSNLMLSDDGVLKIIDFGIACLKDRQPPAGAVMGTPGYMSPEQIRGEPLDERTDVYSLAAVVYELIVGRSPVLPDGPWERMPDPFAVDLSPLPPALAPVMARALAPDRNKRFEGMQPLEAAAAEAVSHA